MTNRGRERTPDMSRDARPHGLIPWVLARRDDLDGRVMWMRLFERPDGTKFVKAGPVVWTPMTIVMPPVTATSGTTGQLILSKVARTTGGASWL